MPFDTLFTNVVVMDLIQLATLVLLLVSVASFFDQHIARATRLRDEQELERKASLLTPGEIGFFERSGRRAARLGLNVSAADMDMRTPEQHFVYMRAFRDELVRIRNLPSGE